jgi:hypothetical protein
MRAHAFIAARVRATKPMAQPLCTQGFASGSLDIDAAAPRMFVDMGLETFVAQSYSKVVGLVGFQAVVLLAAPHPAVRFRGGENGQIGAEAAGFPG